VDHFVENFSTDDSFKTLQSELSQNVFENGNVKKPLSEDVFQKQNNFDVCKLSSHL
jgi:methionine salvage enolase-phosphatase E1